ncbi:MAG: pyruvate, phosphate dikinase [Candidatus Brocadia sp.]|jgi:pyruvate,orthophosphate dikinase
MSPKYVYFFGNGSAEGRADMKHLLGGKGANLAEMTNLGIPVPPGFTITTEVCDAYYKNNKQYPKGLAEEIEQNLSRLEKLMGAKLGDPNNPLLVSVRSGAAASMPGMMDTVLNLGLTPDAVNGLIKKTGNERFVWDAYRRFIAMFGDVVMGVERHYFEEILDKYKKKARVKSDTELTTDQLKKIVEEFKAVYKKKTRENFPNDPKVQLQKAIDAVFASWNNPRAVKYRQLYEIKGLLGTAVNVQAMVFGNMGNHSATGVCFTRNPSTGENKFYGEFLINAQGEDVVAGIRTPEPIANLEKEMPEVYEQLVKYKNILENHFKDVQDIEFTIQENRLFMLQTRTGKRTTQAAVKIAVDMVKEGLIDKKTAISRINPNELDQLLHPTFDPKAKKEIIAVGLPASPGAATGKVVFSAEDAEKWTLEKKEKVILVRKETSPEDIGGMHVAKGILTTRGGMTSHAAVVARGMGKCCVAGCGALHVDYKSQTFKVDGKVIKKGEYISIDGSTGEVMLGMVPTVEPGLSGDFATLMEWADEVRKLKVRTNADTPADAKKARELGAEGIGLCRTEHMFFGENRIDSVRQMILSAPDVKALKAKIAALEKELSKAANNKTDVIKKELMQVKKELKEPLNLYTSALKKLLPMQRRDFEQIFTTMDGLPVTIRLLDPPLHEFLPQEEYNQKEMAKKMKISLKEVQDKVSALHELNPMLGHRGCRLGVTYPEIYEMQVQAIIEAACNVKKKGITVCPEIMLPIISTEQEFNILKDDIHRIAKDVMKKGMQIEYMVGTMIELPRAALIADKIAKHAEFFSFGTNDLTQMTFGFSRDDVGSFVPDYIEKGILEKDPFQILDQEGTGQLVEIGIQRGRSTRPDLKVGICGEHGGNPQTILFCHKVGMNYVSCSPFRVPIARLAAAQAALQQPISQATV